MPRLNRAGLAAAIALAAFAALWRFAALPQAFKSGVPAATQSISPAPRPDADFDFYVLSLSWSPSYCASKGGGADPVQCGGARPLGFTAHGLWPQYERGAPLDCDAASREVDREILRAIDPVMPSDSLARHEWRKHGTCSGLSQRDYFNALTQAVGRVRIPGPFAQTQTARRISPQQVELAFLKANAGMSAKGFAAVCGGGYLSEVRICMTKDLNFRECAEVDRKACRASSIEMPPAR